MRLILCLKRYQSWLPSKLIKIIIFQDNKIHFLQLFQDNKIHFTLSVKSNRFNRIDAISSPSFERLILGAQRRGRKLQEYLLPSVFTDHARNMIIICANRKKKTKSRVLNTWVLTLRNIDYHKIKQRIRYWTLTFWNKLI